MSLLFTSESVTSGHPDKICDTVSDAILDACISQDKYSKVAVDTWVKDNCVGIIGELTSSAKIDFEAIARKTVEAIGYNRAELGFDSHTFEFINRVGKQSHEINTAVVNHEDLGAGDQGLMFGYACKHTVSLLPLPIYLAHKLAQNLEILRRQKEAKGDFSIRPDGKTQVTIEFDDKGAITHIHTILVSTQHSEGINQTQLFELLVEELIKPTLATEGLNSYFDTTLRYLSIQVVALSLVALLQILA